MSLFCSLRNWRAACQRSLGEAHARPRRSRARAHFRPRLEVLEDRRLPSTLTVLNIADSGPGSLRDTIAAADSGDTITFDPSLNGQVINLTSGELVINKSLDIEGPGQGGPSVSVFGNLSSRVFDLTNPSTTVRLANLNIGDGLATQGGGIFDAGVTLYLVHDFLGGEAQGAAGGGGSPGGDGLGGAVFQAGGSLSLTECFVQGNARGGAGDAGTPGGAALGGGIYNAGGFLTVNGCSFSDILAGGDGAPGGSAVGGDIYDTANTNTTIYNSTFVDTLGDQVRGGGGFAGGEAGGAFGGSIFQAGGNLNLTDCRSATQCKSGLTGYRVIVGRAQGGSLYVAGGIVTLVNTTLSGSTQGDAQGGAMYQVAGTVSMNNCTVNGQATGDNGKALGGGVYLGGGSLTLQNCTIGSLAVAAINSAAAEGGGIFQAGGTLTLNNCTFGNSVASTYGTLAEGGGLFIAAGTATIQHCVFEDDAAIGNLGGEGFGGAIFIAPAGSVSLSKDTFLGNSATTGGNDIIGNYTIC